MPSNAEIREANINSALDEVEDNNNQDTSFEPSDASDAQNEPVTKTFNREDYVNDTYSEGAEEAVIEELASKEDITLDDLRSIPGAEGLSDTQLQAAWDKAQAEAGNVNEEQKVELPFPVYDAQGNKVEADKLTLQDLLSGKVQIGYQAMGKEQRKAFTDLIRNASQGHWNEHRYNAVNAEYRQAHAQLQQLQKEAASFKEMQGQWNAALTAMVMGDTSKMKAVVEAYKAELGKTGQAPPSGFVSQDVVAQQREAEQAGMQWWTNEGIPAAYDIASRYNADRGEVQRAVEWFINNEPNLTRERVTEIFQYEVPMLLEKNGYSASGNPTGEGTRSNGVDNSNNEVAELKKQIAAQASAIAELKNGRVASVREKGRRAPAAGSGSTSSAGDSMPSFKDRASMKEWLQS